MLIVTIVCILSFTLGVASAIVATRLRAIGKLRVVHDPYDPSDGPYLSLQLENTTSYLQSKKYVTLKVENDYGYSQK